MNWEEKITGPGGTPGGFLEFFLGLGMTVIGGYLLTSRVTVTSNFWTLWGYNASGISLVPLIFGVGILFFNGRSILGWILSLAGVSIIFAGILMNLTIYFQPTSLLNTIIMLVLLSGGLGLITKSLSAHN